MVGFVESWANFHSGEKGHFTGVTAQILFFPYYGPLYQKQKEPVSTSEEGVGEGVQSRASSLGIPETPRLLASAVALPLALSASSEQEPRIRTFWNGRLG